uniref:NADH-ubiquinone oxidoreductase chain 2 n=1 Tax=Paraechinus aethiopicus TaxID=262775 RepID=H6TDE1_9EUTH|nr:NADH dehydrogenase subunit 2 [Paraechinus aethiopicus]ADZ52836.1 NADH dehydrogenase subunit 2 [Paraechinus aethiopicus]
MNPILALFIYYMLMMGTIMVLMSSHWLLIWIGFEMNLMAMIPIMTYKQNPRSTESAIKYFLIQTTASIMFIMSTSINLMLTGQWTVMHINNNMLSFTITISMLMKLGVAPFHLWLPEVTQGLHLYSSMILLTWQKIAPLSILYTMYPSLNHNIMFISAILSIMLGGWGGLNQTQLRKMMAFSSIAHMGWMMAILCYNPNIMIFNLFIYMIMTITLFMIFKNNSSTNMSNLSIICNKSPITASLLALVLLSLGGLPPLSGFLPKWLVTQELIKNNNMIMASIMLMLSLINLFFYMRLIYSTSLTIFPSMNNMKMYWLYSKSIKYSSLMTSFSIMSILMLPLMPLLTNFY